MAQASSSFASGIEDWSEGDFDLEGRLLDHRIVSIADETSDWDESHIHPNEEVEDEETDTIKLSLADGTRLKQLIAASKATQPTITDVLIDLESTAFDTDGFVQEEDHDSLENAPRPCSASLSSTSTSYTSMFGLSTDATEPDTPSSQGIRAKSYARSTSGSSAGGDSSLGSYANKSSEDDEDFDLAFEVTPALNNLRLCPSLRSLRSHATSDQARHEAWGEESAKSDQPRRDALSSDSISGENDADDEQEDLLEGLELQGSVFETAQAQESLKRTLDALLDQKRSGFDEKASKTADPEADIAAGLIVTDDLDLSPSRIPVPARNHAAQAHTIASRKISLPSAPLNSRYAPPRHQDFESMRASQDSQARRQTSLQTLKSMSSNRSEPLSGSLSSTRASSSRLTSSTVASRARVAETAASRLARASQNATRDSLPARLRLMQTDNSRTSGKGSSPMQEVLRRTTHYGDGYELTEFDDLPGVSSPPSRSDSRPSSRRTGSNDSCASLPPHRRLRNKVQSKPGLIRPLGATNSTQKAIRGMHWNARTLRWDGNESVLRDFDQVVQSSTRPALISQLTGSSTSSAIVAGSGYVSPLSRESSTLMHSIASGVRVVGDMLFDPVHMCWIHKSGAEEEDVFAQLDEPADESQAHDFVKLGEQRDNTIRARRIQSANPLSRMTELWGQPTSLELTDTHAQGGKKYTAELREAAVRRAIARGSFDDGLNIDLDLWDACVEAESRHKADVRGFLVAESVIDSRFRNQSEGSDRSSALADLRQPRPHLYSLSKMAGSTSRPK